MTMPPEYLFLYLAAFTAGYLFIFRR